MRDIDTFETRLAAAYTRLVAEVPTEVDASQLARSVALAEGARAGAFTLRRWLPRRAVLALAVLLVLLTLFALVSLQVGVRRPPPFGPAGNGLIAFDDGHGVLVGDPRSGLTRRLTPAGETILTPVFSPDGTRIAALRTVDEDRVDVVVLDVAGSSVRPVSKLPLVDVTWIDWTPDSRSIVVVSMIDGRRDLRLLDAIGSAEPRELVDDVDVVTPVFRPPAGNQILFAGEARGTVGLYVVNADGSGRRTLIPPRKTTNLGRDLVGARYSADGGRIAVQTWADPPREMRIVVMPAEGGPMTPLRHDPQAWYEGWPSWSPDGSQLATLRLLRGGPDMDGLQEQRVAIVSADASVPTIETGPFGTSGDGRTVEWSPDGRFLIAKSDHDSQLLLDPFGGSPTVLPWTSTSDFSWQRLAP